MVKSAGLLGLMKMLFETAIEDRVSAKLVNKWVPVELWFEACTTIVNPDDFDGKFSLKLFKRCLTTAYGEKTLEQFDPVTNQTGIFKVTVGKAETFLFVLQRGGVGMTAVAPSRQPIITEAFRQEVAVTKEAFDRSKSLRGSGHNIQSILAEDDGGGASKRRKLNDHAPIDNPPRDNRDAMIGRLVDC